MNLRVRTPGEASFQRDIERAKRDLRHDLERAQKTAGDRVLLPAIKSNAPKRTGKLAAGLSIVQKGAQCEVVSREPYGAGAEWGARGKWSGFRGGPPRYAGKALDEKADELARAVLEEIREPLSAYGWFQG